MSKINKRMYISFGFIVLIISSMLFVIFQNKNIKVDFSLKKVDFNSDIRALSLNNLISDEYALQDNNELMPSFKDEEGAIDIAIKATESINNVQNEVFEDTSKYFIRKPRAVFEKSGMDYVFTDEFKQFTDDEMNFWIIWLMWRNNNMHFNKAENIKVINSSKNKFVVNVFLDDVLATLDPNTTEYTHSIDVILEYDIVKENLTGKFKIAHLTSHFLKDLTDYQEGVTIDETNTNKLNILSSKINSFTPNNTKGYDYTLVENIDKQKASMVYENNVSNTVILSANDGYGMSSKGYGFFIKAGLVLTTYDVAKSFLDKDIIKANVITSDNNVHKVEGIITFSAELDLALLKLEDKVGDDKIKINNMPILKRGDPILVIGSPQGIVPILRGGIYTESINNNGVEKIKISLPLLENDKGSPIFDIEGNVIGMNNSTNKDSESNLTDSSYAISSKYIKDVKDKFQDKEFESIKTIEISQIQKDILNRTDSDQNFKDINNNLYKSFLGSPNPEELKSLKLMSVFKKSKYLVLQYKNNSIDFINNITLIDSYSNKLLDNGYKLEKSNSKSRILKKDNEIIRLYSRFNYVSIIYEKK